MPLQKAGKLSPSSKTKHDINFLYRCLEKPKIEQYLTKLLRFNMIFKLQLWGRNIFRKNFGNLSNFSCPQNKIPNILF